MAFRILLRRMERGDLTTHGFRSSFRDCAAEQTNYPNELAEMALAHAVGDKVEAAYRRGDMLQKRHHLAADWAAFCASRRERKVTLSLCRSVNGRQRDESRDRDRSSTG